MNLKYLHTKFITYRGWEHRPAKWVNMTNCHGILTQILIKFRRKSSQAPEDISFVEDNMLLHTLHQFHDTHHQRVEVWVSWQSKFLHPVLQCSGISHGQQQRLLSNILIWQITGEKQIPGDTPGGRRCSVPLAWEGHTSNCWNWKGGADFLS